MLRSVSCIAGGEVSDFHFRSKRDDGNGDQREHHRDKRREEIEELIDMRGQHVLFSKELDDVGERLEQSVRSHAAGPDAELDVGEDFSLDPLDVGESVSAARRRQRGLDEAYYEEVHRQGASAPGRRAPV